LDLGERRDVLFQTARIASEILVRRELCRIDENRNDDAAGASARLFNQSQMTGVQRAHRWNQGNARAAPSVSLNGAAKRRNRAHDGRTVCHFDLDRRLGSAGTGTRPSKLLSIRPF